MIDPDIAINALLITGHSHQVRTVLAEALIAQRHRQFPNEDTSFFAFARTGSELTFINRSLHWVAELDLEASVAASRALAHYLDTSETLTSQGRIEEALLSIHSKAQSDNYMIIYACPSPEDCPINDPFVSYNAS